MQLLFLSQSKNDQAHHYAMKQDHEFGQRFLNLLAEKGLADEPLRVIAKLCGVSIPVVRDYKLGNKIPAMDRARFIADKLDVCVEYFLTGKGPKYPNIVLNIEHPDDLANFIMENPSTYAAILSELQKRDPDLLCLHDVPEKHKPTLKTAVHALEKPHDDGDLAQCA